MVILELKKLKFNIFVPRYRSQSQNKKERFVTGFNQYVYQNLSPPVEIGPDGRREGTQ